MVKGPAVITTSAGHLAQSLNSAPSSGACVPPCSAASALAVIWKL